MTVSATMPECQHVWGNVCASLYLWVTSRVDFWDACVTSVDLTEGYVRGCVGVCFFAVVMIE